MNDSANHSRDDVTAVILAGGAGSRMQFRPKALLPWRGQRFIDHIVAQLRPQAAALAISSNDAAPYASLQLPVLADPFPERRGPLAGMLAGLRFSATPCTLFVPCDSPRLSPALGARLHAALHAHAADVAYAQTGDGDHYLFALLRSALHPRLAAHLERGDFAVKRWYATLRCSAVPFHDTPEYFVNINTPEALQRLPP